jgi:ABC-type uncharacterized transport system substrate-binding protein
MIRLLAALCLSVAQALQAAPLSVAIVHSEERELYHAFDSALRYELTGRDGVRLLPADAPLQDADLVVAVGAKAASLAAGSRAPILHVMTSRATLEARGRAASGKNAAIFMEQPVSRQLGLLRAALPHARSIGVLVSSPPEELASLKPLAEAAGFTVHVHTVAEPSGLAEGLSEVLAVSDVLLVLPDAAIYRADTIRNILLATYRKQTPMIGLSQSYVRAGALCAVYSTPAQIARQAGVAILHYAQSGRLPPDSYPQDFEVAVNTQVARSLGLTIKSAQQLREETGRKP